MLRGKGGDPLVLLAPGPPILAGRSFEIAR